MSNEKFQPLINPHAHSHYSLDGAATVEDMVLHLKEQGSSYAALTEHGNMASALELYSVCKKHHIKPILGIELYIEPPFLDELRIPIAAELDASKKFDSPDDREIAIQKALKNEYAHLTVHFKDEWAYAYFCKLTPKMEDRAVVKWGERKPIATLEEVAGASGHITICSSCIIGICGKFLLPRRKSKWSNPALAEKAYHLIRDIAGKDNFFLEVFPHEVNKDWQKPDKKAGTKGFFKPNECTDFAPDGDIQKPVNNFIIEMAKKNNDKIIVSLDAHFARPEQELVQISRLGNGDENWRFSNTYNLMSSDEAYSILNKMHHIEESTMHKWIENSYTWASNFDNFSLKTKKDRFILMPLADEWQDQLISIINRVGRMRWDDPVWTERLQREIDTIVYNKVGNLMSYMFTIEDLVSAARQNGILVMPRGSGGGSLLLYVMGVSGINPIQYGLSFERFLTKGRLESGNIPDVDLDFSNQEWAFKYLEEKYKDSFCQISTDTQLKIKSSIKDAERSILGEVRVETEKLCKTIPASPQGANEYDYVFGHQDDHDHHINGLFDEHAGLQKYAKENPEIWNSVKEMLGINRQKSVHSCGVVLAPEPIQNYIPVTYINKTRVTGYNPKNTELAGLVKYDVLGVNTLRDIEETQKLIKARYGTDLDVYNLPDDPKVWTAFQLGQTETVFQFDTPTIRPYLKSTHPSSISDLTALTSLGRPGTLDAPEGDGSTRTLAEVYVARRNGEPIKYLHPDLEPILKETAGIALYQEQTMRMFKDIAGYSDAESDDVRRAVGKKDKKVLEAQTQELRRRILTKGTWTENQIDLLIKQIMASASYGFNKSHAAAYSVIAYANQYLKLNYPIEWWTSILKNASKDDLKRYWASVQHLILMPSINESTESFRIVDKDDRSYIQAPITLLDGVGPATTAEIAAKKPFINFEDFIMRVDRRVINKRNVFKFIFSGLLDSLFPPNHTDTQKIDDYLQLRRKIDGKEEPIPEDMINLSPLQKLIHKRSIFTVYKVDWTDTAIPYLVDRGLIGPYGNIYVYKDPNRKDLNGRPFLGLDGLKHRLDPRNKFDDTFGIVGYVASNEEISYNRKQTNPETGAVEMVPNTMKKFLVECGDVNMEVIKWPDWGESSHGIATDLEEKVCLFILQRKMHPDKGLQLTVKKVFDITNIDKP